MSQGGAYHVQGPLLYDTSTQTNGWMPYELESEESVTYFLDNTHRLSGALKREEAIKHGLACEYVFGAQDVLWLASPSDIHAFLLTAAQSFDLCWTTPRDSSMFAFSVSVTGSILSAMRRTPNMNLPYGGLGKVAES